MQNSTQTLTNHQLTRTRRRAQKRVYNPVERSLYHRKQSESVALKLHKVAGDSLLDAQDKIKRFTGRSEFVGKLAAAKNQLRIATEAIAMSCRIWTCADPSNHFTATDLVTSDGTGECFDGYGILAGCGHKLCPACIAKDGKGNRREAEYAYKAVSKIMLSNERWRFVTFTMPPIYKGIVITNKILRTAWRSFVNSEYFSETFRGSIKGIEFTMGDKRNKRKRYHWHIHLVALGFFINKDELKARWTNHVERAFKKFGLVFQSQATDGFAVVNVKEVVKRVSDSSNYETKEGALFEVCKYMTKSDSWRDIPAAHLLEVASIRRWSRMFSTTGVCREVLEAKNNAKKALKEAQLLALAEQKAKRAVLEKEYKTKLKFLEAEENLEAETEDLCSYNGLNVRFTEPIKIKLGRENWRDMASRVGLPAYFLHRAKQMTLQIIIRKSQLVEKFGFATFTDQNKKCWYAPKAVDSGVLDEIILNAESLIDIDERLEGCASSDQFDEIMRAKDDTIAWIKKRLVEIGIDQGEASSEAVVTFENISRRLNYIGQNLKGFIDYNNTKNVVANKSSKVQDVGTSSQFLGNWTVDLDRVWIVGRYEVTRNSTVINDKEMAKFVGPVEQVKNFELYNSETQTAVRTCRFYPSEVERTNHSLARSKKAYMKWNPTDNCRIG